MKEKLLLIRNLVESIIEKAEDIGDSGEIIFEELDKLEPVADHLDDCEDFDIESWAETLRQLLEDMND